MQTTLDASEVSGLSGHTSAPEEEFAAFYSATWSRSYRTALGITADPGRAEDAAQSAYAKAYSRWRAIKRVDHPEAYLLRMVVNEALGTFRRGWWRSERLAAEPPEPPAAASPEESALVRADLLSALGELPPGQRAVLVLRYYEDLTEAEIAGVLRVSRGTVKSQASAALANLRTKGVTR